MIYNLHLPSKLVKLIKPSKGGLISAVKGHCARVMAIDYIVLGLLGLSSNLKGGVAWQSLQVLLL